LAAGSRTIGRYAQKYPDCWKAELVLLPIAARCALPAADRETGACCSEERTRQARL